MPLLGELVTAPNQIPIWFCFKLYHISYFFVNIKFINTQRIKNTGGEECRCSFLCFGTETVYVKKITLFIEKTAAEKKAVGVLEKTSTIPFPSALGDNAPCFITDGTPTKGVKGTKNSASPRHLCTDFQYDFFSYGLLKGFSKAPKTHPCEFKSNYNRCLYRFQVLKY